eukprot:JZ548735.1.p1 GENE.JZ548735.1~~JZ548735.1.p1  ORF type:complete len:198 (+),score=11.88 JZ548735.1:58-651(+)
MDRGTLITGGVLLFLCGFVLVLQYNSEMYVPELENMDEAFDTLGLPPKAPIADVRKAFKKLTLMYHPDRNKSPEATATFIRIRKAYELASGEEAEVIMRTFMEKQEVERQIALARDVSASPMGFSTLLMFAVLFEAIRRSCLKCFGKKKPSFSVVDENGVHTIRHPVGEEEEEYDYSESESDSGSSSDGRVAHLHHQ